MSEHKPINTLSLTILQRYKITDMIHGLKDGSPGQIIAGGRICQIIEITPEEVDKFEFRAVYKDDKSRDIIGHQWKPEGNDHKVDFTLTDHQSIHLRKFLLTNPYVQITDFIWLNELFDQLGVKDDELQSF